MSTVECDPHFLLALVASFQRWTQRDLLVASRQGDVGASEDSNLSDARDLRARLDQLPAVIVAHNRAEDPVFVYANDLACQLWEMPKHKLIGMPSRLTAEPVHRDERAALLERTRQHGFVDDYRGIRITANGKRFWIEQATLWNIVDADDQLLGQAALFDHWTWIDPDTQLPT